MRLVRTISAALLSALVTLVVVSACDEGVTAQPCSNIPEGGCPLSRGLACSDPECVAAYACRPGNRWELDHLCPPREDGASQDAGTGVPPAHDASIDAPAGAFGGPGCEILQEPDCPLGFALACSAGCCDCSDLYVCENGGWSFWGTCDDAGIRAIPEEP